MGSNSVCNPSQLGPLGFTYHPEAMQFLNDITVASPPARPCSLLPTQPQTQPQLNLPQYWGWAPISQLRPTKPQSPTKGSSKLQKTRGEAAPTSSLHHFRAEGRAGLPDLGRKEEFYVSG